MRVCLPVAVEHGGCWLVVVVAVGGVVILSGTTLGTNKSRKIDKFHKIHAPKFQDVFFMRLPNRRRQATTSRTARGNYHFGGKLPPRGDLETGLKSQLLVEMVVYLSFKTR